MDKRRLSAIMFTDIVGYTRKMGENESRMLRLLGDHNRIVEAAVAEEHGTIVKRIGDAFLVRFESGLNAVQCALAIQKGQAAYNEGKDEGEQVQIRIGIHLGDIIEQDGDVFGDGVNVASRVEPLAHADGICVTRSVYDTVKKRMAVNAVSLGPQNLKNVDDAVEVFHLLTDQVGIPQLRKAKKLQRKKTPIGAIFALLGVVVITVGLLLVAREVLLPALESTTPDGIPSVEVVNNRVAVLPLRNLTGQPADDYICEGVSEELIFRLSRVDDLYVFPLAEVFALKEDRRSASGVRAALGVQFLVQGSLGLEGDSLVATVEVMDTENLDRLSSKRYREANGQHHRLHDRIVRDVLFPIVGRVSGDDEGALAAYASSNSLASDLYLQARHAQRAAVTWAEQQQVLRLYETAIENDDRFALAGAHLAEAYASVYGQWQSDTSWVSRAEEQALRAVELSPQLPEAHYALGVAYEKKVEHGLAADAYRAAIRLRPDYRAPRSALGGLFASTSRYQEALSLFQQSLELARSYGDRSGEAETLNDIGKVHVRMRELDTALTQFTTSLAIAREVGDRRAEAHALNNIGVVHQYQKDYEGARDQFAASLEIKREIGDRWGESSSLNNLGATTARLGDLDGALEYYQQSLELKRTIGDRRREASTLHNIGMIHGMRDELQDALNYYQQSLVVKQELDDKKGQASSLEKMGEIYLALGQRDKARQAFSDALTLYQAVGDEKGIAKVQEQLSDNPS